MSDSQATDPLAIELAEDRNAEITQGIARAARAAASRAVEISGGGLALLFANAAGDRTPTATPPLRAAAGFPSPNTARQAADLIVDELAQVAAQSHPRTFPGPQALGQRGTGGLVGIPLAVEDRVHGALLVASPSALSDSAVEALVHVAESVAIRMDHAVLRNELGELHLSALQDRLTADQKGEELLKLSEELFAQDIELRRNSEKLGSIEKLKDDFIEKMSRELRSPLNNIIESIISVLAGENDALSDENRQALRTALDEGTSFLRTLQNILDLWRIKQGELPVEAQDVNFREVVEEVIFSIQDTTERKSVSVEKQIEEPFPKIRTDLAKVHQILFMLLDNAAKFTPRGSINVRAGVADGRLNCEIEDTGIGICADDRQLVFDEFYQVDDAGPGQNQGAGLGLALVRDLMVLMDGELTLTSEVGQGTKVSFSIPVQVVG